MRKTRYFLLPAVTLVLTAILASCFSGTGSQSYQGSSAAARIFNGDLIEDSTPMFTQHMSLDRLNEYAGDYALVVDSQHSHGDTVVIHGTYIAKANAKDAVAAEDGSVAVAEAETAIEAQAETVTEVDTKVQELFADSSLLLVYSLRTDKVLYHEEYVAQKIGVDSDGEAELTHTSVSASVTADAFFTVQRTTSVESTSGVTSEVATELYDIEGNCLKAVSKDLSLLSLGRDVYQFDRTLYHVADGVPTELSTVPAYNQIRSFDYFDGTYFYKVSPHAAYVEIYSVSMEPVYKWSYTATDGQIIPSVYVLDNGHIFAQILSLLPENDDSYDVLIQGSRFSLKSLLIDPIGKTEKPLNLKFMVADLTNSLVGDMDLYASSVENVATVVYIKNHLLDMNERENVALSNKLKVGMTLSPISDFEAETQQLSTYGNGYFCVNADGQKYVFDKSGHQVATYSADLLHNQRYLISESAGIIYDYALNELYVCDESTSIYKIEDTYVLLIRQAADKTEYLCFNGEITELFTMQPNRGDISFGDLKEGESLTLTSYELFSHYYVKAETSISTDGMTTLYSYYAFNETLLHRGECRMATVHSGDTALLLQDTEGSFHRISG